MLHSIFIIRKVQLFLYQGKKMSFPPPKKRFTTKPEVPPKPEISPSKQEVSAPKQEIISKEEEVPKNEANLKQVGNASLENAQNNEVAETPSDQTSGENSGSNVADPSLKTHRKKPFAKKMLKWILIISIFIGIAAVLWTCLFTPEEDDDSELTLFLHKQGLNEALTSRKLISNKDPSTAIRFLTEDISGQKYAVIKYSNDMELENIKNKIAPGSGELFTETTGVQTWLLEIQDILTKYGKCLVELSKSMITKIKALV